MNFNYYQFFAILIYIWVTMLGVSAFGAAFFFIFIGPKRVFKALEMLKSFQEIVFSVREHEIKREIAFDKSMDEFNRKLEIMNKHYENLRINLRLNDIVSEKFEKEESTDEPETTVYVDDFERAENTNNQLKKELEERKIENVHDNIVDFNKNNDEYGEEEYDFMHEKLCEVSKDMSSFKNINPKEVNSKSILKNENEAHEKLSKISHEKLTENAPFIENKNRFTSLENKKNINPKFLNSIKKSHNDMIDSAHHYINAMNELNNKPKFYNTARYSSIIDDSIKNQIEDETFDKIDMQKNNEIEILGQKKLYENNEINYDDEVKFYEKLGN